MDIKILLTNSGIESVNIIDGKFKENNVLKINTVLTRNNMIKHW